MLAFIPSQRLVLNAFLGEDLTVLFCSTECAKYDRSGGFVILWLSKAFTNKGVFLVWVGRAYK